MDGLERWTGPSVSILPTGRFADVCDGYTVFDAASAFGERNLNSRYAHWFYSFQTRRYVDTFLAGDLILDEFFIYGPGYDRLFQQLNDLVGPEPLLPKKGYGFFQTEADDCQASQTKLMELARKFRDRDIPVDTLILDLEWGTDALEGSPKIGAASIGIHLIPGRHP